MRLAIVSYDRINKNIIQTFTIMASAKTERQKYRLVHSEKEFEIRHYPSATLATVYSSAKSYRELVGSGFRRLAGYIFGGNESAQKISMTAPVHMDINDTRSAMSFVMPSAYEMGNLPMPNDSGVILQKTDDEYVAVLWFRGYASDKDIKKYSEKLAGETKSLYRSLGRKIKLRPLFSSIP